MPSDEVTAMLHKVVSTIASEGLEFQRIRAAEILEEEGVIGRLQDGFMFSLFRTVPGIENVDFGRYRLPEAWESATRNRMWRFSAGRLNILEAEYLLDMLDYAAEDADRNPHEVEALPQGLDNMRERLRAEIPR